MARIFLSYDREDAGRARPVALALEKAGHSVWWDRHIKGGSQYSKEIERELKRADAVVVLWSAQSVESAWVRDEAAAGRDSGRLVPLRIDNSEPPLGFRQYHNIDLSRWRGRMPPAEFRQVLEAIEALAGAPATMAATATVPCYVSQPPGRRLRIIIAAMLVVLLLAGAFFAWRLIAIRSTVPTVAVAVADDSASSRNAARDLLVNLGTLQTADPKSLDLVEYEQRGGNADLIFEVGGTEDARTSRINLVLLNGQDRSILWSREYQYPRERQADLQQQLGHAAALVLDCALEGVAARIDTQTLKLYLSGCALLAEAAVKDPENLVFLFREITAKAPRLEGAWAKLLQVEGRALVFLGKANDPSFRRDLQRHIAAARAINPNLSQAFGAEVELLPQQQFAERMRLLDEAARRNPRDSFAFARRSLELTRIGRIREAVRDARRAAELDPLSPFARDRYIAALADAGNVEAALAELDRADRLWRGASNLIETRYGVLLRYGNPHEARRILTSGAVSPEGVDIDHAFLQARLDPSPANIGRAVTGARAAMDRTPQAVISYAQILGAFRRNEELFNMLLKGKADPIVLRVLFRQTFQDFWRDRRSIQVAERFGLLDYWRTSGKWPDFCFDPNLPYDCRAEAKKLS